jgi:N-acyl-D-aspartate/D-glutamate deacylase
MNEELQSRLLVDPLISICSDGSPNGYHPRGHGTFARIIEKYVVGEQKLILEEAIRKMTSYAASILHISDRGKIEVGKKADLILFDPLAVKEKADYTDPFQLAEGFNVVIVNGKIARENGEQSQKLFGKVLKPE